MTWPPCTTLKAGTPRPRRSPRECWPSTRRRWDPTIDLAEQQRGHASGAEQERANSFAKFAQAFERMVAWQSELGDADEALQAIERSHARSLLDQMALGSVDLLAGLPPEQAQSLRRREVEARARVAELEARLRLPAKGPAYHPSSAASSKPIWTRRARATSKPTAISATSAPLIASTSPGTASPCRWPTCNAGSPSMMRCCSSTCWATTGVPGTDGSPAERLAVLWQALVPEPERKAILGGKVKRLVIIPDGPLALLPFEALVVEEGREPKYLLDAGPPVLYAPSATVLYNVAERPAAKPAADREPVLAVGDPAYDTTGLEDPTPTTALAALTARSRYSTVGGRLSRLPNSGLEARWVVKQFSDAGINATSVSGVSATERGVRTWAPGRRVLHLACHGLADQTHGNFFGALALTPGPKGSVDPSDDGLLTLPEIYELGLKGTELAILSACQTNYGPRQKGEGTWALSRGFLVAGARRVVASNWLVDDEAAASLVSLFCGGLAQAEKAGKPVDHAAALQAAKRWVRQQEKWRSPYYWASMVLVGPR